MLSIEEKVDFGRLFGKAEQKIAERLEKTKHLYVDDSRGNENFCLIPVFDSREHDGDAVCQFRFSRNSVETEAEAVERFNEELAQFLGQNWKRLDK